ncbi:MAG: hypothetical protein KME19_14800 [Microcoleus vaginatus WJT46-NPBG5]|jgi:hypothetical protein|nr:hypothetical protein [Microcoleus vaginatus WJT46-NPBG5]
MKKTWVSLGVMALCLASFSRGKAASAFPLQDGVYRVGSRYIQIAQQNERICFRGFSMRGATIASVEPDPERPDFYIINGLDNTVLTQQDIDTLLIGPINRLLKYPADYEFPRDLDEDLQECLNSTEPFYKQISGGRGGR